MKNKPTSKLIHYECTKCKHNWVPRKLPVVECPKCKNPRYIKEVEEKDNDFS